MRLDHLTEYLLFIAGWLAKGTIANICGQLIFWPIGTRVIRYAVNNETKTAKWLLHHLNNHPTWQVQACQLCQSPSVS